MALVLTLRLGDRFYVRDDVFCVKQIRSATDIDLIDTSGHVYTISDKEGTEVRPDVSISAGDYLVLGAIRLAVEAPREIEITRGGHRRRRAQSPRTQGCGLKQTNHHRSVD